MEMINLNAKGAKTNSNNINDLKAVRPLNLIKYFQR